MMRRTIATGIVAAIPTGLVFLRVESQELTGGFTPVFDALWPPCFAPQLVSIFLAGSLFDERPPFPEGKAVFYLIAWLACWPASWVYVLACEKAYYRFTEAREPN